MGYIAPPSVVLQLDRPRKWQFDANAFIALQQALGEKAFDRIFALSPAGDAPLKVTAETIEVFRGLLYCGLVSDDPEATLQSIGKLVTPRTMMDQLPQILEAMNRGLQDPTPAAANQAQPQPSTSGPSPE